MRSFVKVSALYDCMYSRVFHTFLLNLEILFYCKRYSKFSCGVHRIVKSISICKDINKFKENFDVCKQREWLVPKNWAHFYKKSENLILLTENHYRKVEMI